MDSGKINISTFDFCRALLLDGHQIDKFFLYYVVMTIKEVMIATIQEDLIRH